MNVIGRSASIAAAVLCIALSRQAQPAQIAPAAVHPVSAYAQLPGIRLWYRDSGGTGIPVVLMHPATGSTDSWAYQYPVLEALGYRVISYDRRGSGRTVIVPDADLPPATDADDLLTLVNYLHVDRFHLLGCAAGAFGALEFAIVQPGRLLSLVVANSLGGVKDEEFDSIGRRLRPSPQFDDLPVDFKELGPSYRAANPAGTQRWLEIYRQSRQTQPVMRQPLRYDMTLASLEKIRTPTLLITGDADLYAPPPVQEMFRKRIPNAISVVIPEAGHSAFWEQPELFNRAVVEFLDSHRPREISPSRR